MHERVPGMPWTIDLAARIVGLVVRQEQKRMERRLSRRGGIQLSAQWTANTKRPGTRTPRPDSLKYRAETEELKARAPKKRGAS